MLWLLLVAVGGGGVGAAIGSTLLSREVTPAGRPSSPVPGSTPRAAAGVSPESAFLGLDELVHRVEALEARSGLPRTGAHSERDLVGLTARLAELEERLIEMEHAASWLAIIPDTGTAKEFLDALAVFTGGSSRSGSALERIAALARIHLRVQFLDSFPTHERASREFSALVEDYMRVNQLGRGAEVIEHLGEKLGIPSWDMDWKRLQVANRSGNWMALSSASQRLVLQHPEEWGRAHARLHWARALGKLGDGPGAVAVVDELLRLYSGTGNLDSQTKYAVEQASRLRERILQG